jgi:tetratricopeptide (TPR) repeat protein
MEQEQFKNIKNKKKRAQMIRAAAKRRVQDALRGQLESGFRKFREAATAGQYERAAAEFERIGETTPNKEARSRAKELARKVRDFGKALSEADQLDGDQSYEAEIAPLERAVSALDQVDGSVPAMPRLKARLVRGLVLKGHNAGARQDYAVAAKSFSRALVVHPGDPQAKDGLQQLRGRAHDVYLQAYEEETRDPEAARKLYGAVLQMLNPSDDDYQKAKRHLEGMSK